MINYPLDVLRDTAEQPVTPISYLQLLTLSQRGQKNKIWGISGFCLLACGTHDLVSQSLRNAGFHLTVQMQLLEPRL